eukprot:4804515-Amphidinium_carterae.1
MPKYEAHLPDCGVFCLHFKSCWGRPYRALLLTWECQIVRLQPAFHKCALGCNACYGTESSEQLEQLVEGCATCMCRTVLISRPVQASAPARGAVGTHGRSKLISVETSFTLENGEMLFECVDVGALEDQASSLVCRENLVKSLELELLKTIEVTMKCTYLTLTQSFRSREGFSECFHLQAARAQRLEPRR